MKRYVIEGNNTKALIEDCPDKIEIKTISTAFLFGIRLNILQIKQEHISLGFLLKETMRRGK